MTEIVVTEHLYTPRTAPIGDAAEAIARSVVEKLGDHGFFTPAELATLSRWARYYRDNSVVIWDDADQALLEKIEGEG